MNAFNQGKFYDLKETEMVILSRGQNTAGVESCQTVLRKIDASKQENPKYLGTWQNINARLMNLLVPLSF